MGVAIIDLPPVLYLMYCSGSVRVSVHKSVALATPEVWVPFLLGSRTKKWTVVTLDKSVYVNGLFYRTVLPNAILVKHLFIVKDFLDYLRIGIVLLQCRR